MRLVHAQVDGEIGKAVGDDLALVDLDALEDMGMVPEHQISPCIDRRIGDFALVIGDHGGHEMDAGVVG